MFSYKFIIDSGRGNALRLRLTNKRRKAEVSLGVRMSQETLDDALSDNPKPENIKWRSVLSLFQSKLDTIKCELLKAGRGDEDVKSIREIVMRECLNVEDTNEEQTSKTTFVSVFQTFIDKKDNPGTKRVYKHTLDRIRTFDSGVDGKSFEEIDLKWLNDFEAFCAKTASKNARNIHLRNIRAVFNVAIDEGLTTAYPFRRFKIRPESTRKRSLSADELRRIFDFPVESYAEIYRDMFKLIFMLVGINCVDLHRLKEVTGDGRIEYRRAKTGRRYSIKVEPEAMEIIEKYRGKSGLLCIADRWSDHHNFLHQCNKALQSIGVTKRSGRGGKKSVIPEWPELSTYWARHSWATIARKIGVSVDDIALALGHSDGKHETTFIYIDESEVLEAVDRANRRVLDWVLYGKNNPTDHILRL